MHNIITRPATLADIDTLLLFEQGVINAERPFDPTLRTDDINYYDLHGLITAPHIELIVAEIDGKVTGSGYARIETSKHYLKHQQHAYLGFMYVLPEHRGKGVNQAVISALKTWAQNRGITELRLEVYAENTAALRAYEKVGFRGLLLEMRMDI